MGRSERDERGEKTGEEGEKDEEGDDRGRGVGGGGSNIQFCPSCKFNSVQRNIVLNVCLDEIVSWSAYQAGD